MQVLLMLNGKTDQAFVSEGFAMFETRIKRYIKFATVVIPALKNTKNMPVEAQKSAETELMMAQLQSSDTVVLLDENGQSYSSIKFADFLQRQMNAGIKRLVFVVGGPYGFSETMHQRANAKISLSDMTFSHQIIRLIFAEQLYRAFTILNNEPYHNV
ncbi:MAG: 23S rRNA (pseudouridine(1915)-N(3))-methyltransferase RlmH [Bacteroidales bacterium]|nr:23S rRNA (pseudouridine(1915)-N(3))-methyltransferase RlmH [Bacteroidales bacterium]